MKKDPTYDQMSPFEFQKILIKMAKDASEENQMPVRNAGRGNPNFLNTTVRDAMSFLMHFMSQLSDSKCEHKHLGFQPKRKGIAKKLQTFLEENHTGNGAKFLDQAIHFAEENYHLAPDDFIYELGDGALGDFYPVPPRIFPNAEKIFNQYIHRILANKMPSQWFDMFATEGASMAMVYIFNTLKENHLLVPGDSIAIVTPIFSPYLEIPELKDYDLNEVFIEASEKEQWQLPQGELKKLEDPKIKALFIVNPSNPPGVSLDPKSCEKLAKLVKEKRPDLIIITDDVYANFVNDFVSISYLLPENTIGVYSYSKYFGVTGWRLGLIMVHENNIFDQKIRALPDKLQKELHDRYCIDSADPRHIKFIDRLEIDSRDVALAHTGGVSGPQQSFMCLLSLFELMDKNYSYKKMLHALLKKRIDLLHEHLGIDLLTGPHYSHYYIMININHVAKARHGEAFAKRLDQEVTIYDFLLKLAEETATICLPGNGFGGPEHTLRVSLANLYDEDYAHIGDHIVQVIDLYHKEMKLSA